MMTNEEWTTTCCENVMKQSSVLPSKVLHRLEQQQTYSTVIAKY